jgi:hypothetical protein
MLSLLLVVSCREHKPPTATTIVAQTEVETQFSLAALNAEFRDRRFHHVASTAKLPKDVYEMLRAIFPERDVNMAEPGEPYNDSCMPVLGQYSRRLVVAAVSENFAIVSFERGGFAPSAEVVVFERHKKASLSEPVWRAPVQERFTSLEAIGSFFQAAERPPLSGVPTIH